MTLAQFNMDGRVALVFGKESAGLPPEFYEQYRDE